MAQKYISSSWDRDSKNALNDNFKELYNEYIGAGLNATEARQKALESLSKSVQALANSESTQTQLDTIVIEGDSSVEAAQARVDSEGQAHNTLKARLDAEHNTVTSQLAETTQLIGDKIAGEVDDTNRIQRAVDSGNKRILFRAGETYTISSNIILQDGLILQGNGCFIKGNFGFVVSNTSYVTIEGFVFDGNELNNKRVDSIVSDDGNFRNLKIKNNTFIAAAIRLGDVLRTNTKSKGVLIEGNKFTGNYGLKTNGYWDTLSVGYCDDIDILHNVFDGTEMYRFIKLVGKTSSLTHANVPNGSLISNPKDANNRILIAYNKFHGSLDVFPDFTYTKQAIDLYYGNNNVDIIYNDFDLKNSEYPCESVIESKNHGSSPGAYNNSLERINISNNKIKGKFLRAIKIMGLRGTGINEIDNTVKIWNNEIELDIDYPKFSGNVSFIEVVRNYKVVIEDNDCKFKYATIPSDITNIHAVWHRECVYTRIANNSFKPFGNLYFQGLATVTGVTFNNVTIMKELTIEGNYMEYFGARALHHVNIGGSLPEPITTLKVINNAFENTVDANTFTNISGLYKDISYINNRSTIQTFNRDLGAMCNKPIVNDGNDWSKAGSTPLGKWYAGQIIWSKDPAATNCAGWICTADGNPATWKQISII